jgi:hypothetical protein
MAAFWDIVLRSLFKVENMSEMGTANISQMRRLINREGCGRKQSRLNMHYPGIYLMELRKTTKIFS